MTEVIVVLTTTETPDEAERLARLLVERRLAACVQALPITSIYCWQGAVERATETLLLVKTRRELYAAVEAEIKAHHSYQTPEIIALPVESGSSDYLSWLAASTAAQD